MWARSDLHRLARPHKHAFIGSQIRLSRVVFGHLPDINKLPVVVALEFIYTFLRNGALASFAPSPTRESCDEDHPGEGRERELSRH
jgi:hypothetical protein